MIKLAIDRALQKFNHIFYPFFKNNFQEMQIEFIFNAISFLFQNYLVFNADYNFVSMEQFLMDLPGLIIFFVLDYSILMSRSTKTSFVDSIHLIEETE